MQKYRFLRFGAKVLRIVAWIVLIVGVIGSVAIGIGVMGLLADMGAVARILIAAAGIIGSFLAWVLLLVIRDMLYLLMDLEENTRMTAERMFLAKKSRRD